MSSRWCLENWQGSVSREGSKDTLYPPQRAPLDTVLPPQKAPKQCPRMVSGGYCEGFCWTRLRNTWIMAPKINCPKITCCNATDFCRNALGVSQRPLTLILPQKYRDTNGRRIVIQIGGVYTTFCHREGIHLQKYAIEMGGVSRYFFHVLGSGVDLTLLPHAAHSCRHNAIQRPLLLRHVNSHPQSVACGQ